MGSVTAALGSMSGLRLAAIVVVAVLLYVLPTLVTWWRGHRNLQDLAKANLLLGWTGAHWIVAMRRALGPRRRRTADLEPYERMPWWSLRERRRGEW